MLDDSSLGKYITLIIVFAATYLIGTYIFGHSKNQTKSLVSAKLDFFQESSQVLFITTITPKQILQFFLAFVFVSGGIVFFVSGSVVLGLIVCTVIWFLPSPIVSILKQKRLEEFEENFPSTLDKMVSSSKAGLSLIQIFEVVADLDRGPAGQEFGRAVQDYKLGKDLAEVIEQMSERIGSGLFDLFATAVLVNRDKGGNLPEALHTMSKSFKEIMRLEEKVTTASSEGRKGARIISMMPFFIFLFVVTMQPSMINDLTGSVIGWILLTIAAVFYIAGLMWLRRMLVIDI